VSTFKIDWWTSLTPDELRQKGRTLVRESLHKDMLICQLVQFGSVDAMPKVFADEVRQILAMYCEDDLPKPTET
jgi:hypothetical protein